jgi:peptidoglycan/xylan/chitin deacetylase (PgdA/CDA1 family)
VTTRTYAERRAAQPDGLFRIPTTEPMVALTFDDGPDPLYTPTVLDLLRTTGSTATFFLVAVNAAVELDLVRQILDAGHSIGNHTYDHRDLELLTSEQVQVEIEKAQASLVAAGCPSPDLFRPPKGYTDEVVGVLADADSYRTIFWDACVEHFVDHQPVADGVAQMLAKAQPGSIILAHDSGRIVGSGSTPLSRARTIEALPALIQGLTDKGLQVVDVPTLLAATGTPVLPTQTTGQS